MNDLTEDFRSVSDAIPHVSFQETQGTLDSKMVSRNDQADGFNTEKIDSVLREATQLLATLTRKPSVCIRTIAALRNPPV